MLEGSEIIYNCVSDFCTKELSTLKAFSDCGILGTKGNNLLWTIWNMVAVDD